LKTNNKAATVWTRLNFKHKNIMILNWQGIKLEELLTKLDIVEREAHLELIERLRQKAEENKIH